MPPFTTRRLFSANTALSSVVQFLPDLLFTKWFSTEMLWSCQIFVYSSTPTSWILEYLFTKIILQLNQNTLLWIFWAHCRPSAGVWLGQNPNPWMTPRFLKFTFVNFMYYDTIMSIKKNKKMSIIKFPRRERSERKVAYR